jgi:hypothetical protein
LPGASFLLRSALRPIGQGLISPRRNDIIRLMQPDRGGARLLTATEIEEFEGL